MALRARVRQLASIANVALDVLFVLVALVTAGIAVFLVGFAYQTNPLLGLACAALAIALIVFMWSKKQRVGTMLNTIENIVDGSAERAKQFVLGLLDEVLSSVAMSFAVVPGVLAVGGVIATLFHYGSLAGFCLALAAILGCVATCLYSGVKFIAHREADRLIQNIIGKSNEETPLVK